MSCKIVYIFPIKSEVKQEKININDIKRFVFSVMRTYANLGDNITIYTDFDGAYVFSTLFPSYVKVIYSNTITDFYSKVKNMQDGKYCIVGNNVILKSQTSFKKKYLLDDVTINPESIDSNVSDEYIDVLSKKIYGCIYDKFITNLNYKIKQLK